LVLRLLGVGGWVHCPRIGICRVDGWRRDFWDVCYRTRWGRDVTSELASSGGACA
jgi:hypothetical protein